MARPRRGRGNLAVPSWITGMSSAKSQAVARDCHVGLRPPRNDKFVSRCSRRKYLQICDCLRRSLSAATDAIGAHHFSIPGASCQYCAGPGCPLPCNGGCGRRHCSERKSGRGSPRPPWPPLHSAAHAKQIAQHRPDRTAIKITDTEHGKPPPVDSSREDWTDDTRSVTVLQPQEFPFSLSNGTLPLISGFKPEYLSKSAIDREKTLVLRTKVVFW